MSSDFLKHAKMNWVRYSQYEWKKSAAGHLYLLPAQGAKPSVYNPLKEAQTLVLDALNIGRMCMRKKPDIDIQEEILQFAQRYGLMGFMTALPTTADFMAYEAVYLPKNHFIREETMRTEEYLALFFPFEKPEVAKRGIESMWNIRDDSTMSALAMSLADSPMAVNMSFQRMYGERFEWLKKQFTDWAFSFMGCFFYYEDYDHIDDDSRRLMREGMAAFGGNAPMYHIALLDKPTLVWDFHSLMLGVQLMFGFMLTDDSKPLRMCKQCTKIFVADHPRNVFCSPQCRSQHSTRKGRMKGKEKE